MGGENVRYVRRSSARRTLHTPAPRLIYIAGDRDRDEENLTLLFFIVSSFGTRHTMLHSDFHLEATYYRLYRPHILRHATLYGNRVDAPDRARIPHLHPHTAFSMYRGKCAILSVSRLTDSSTQFIRPTRFACARSADTVYT